MKIIKKILNIVLPIVLLSSTAFASKTVTCADYVYNVAEREGITWDEVVNAGAAGVGSIAGGLITASSFVHVLGNDKPGSKFLVYASIATGAVVGALIAGGIAYLITSNLIDVINLSDEVELGGTGKTIDTIINSILISLPEQKKIELSHGNSREIIRTQISEVIINQPEICNSTSSKQILNDISDAVKNRL